MEQLTLRVIKKRILEIQRQSASDYRDLVDKARMQHDYRLSQLEFIKKLCEDNMSLQETKLQPKFEPERS